MAVDEFKFSLTPSSSRTTSSFLARLRDYLQRKTGHSVRLVTKRTYQEITSLLISRWLRSTMSLSTRLREIGHAEGATARRPDVA